jgi:hypothetical protein
MAYDYLKTAGLLKVYATYQQKHPQHQFLRDMMFGTNIISTSDDITVETQRLGQKVANSVARNTDPNSGKGENSYKISTYTPPSFSERRSLTTADLKSMVFGETPTAPFTPEQRRVAKLAEKIANVDRMFLRTEELQCAEALTTGKVKMADGSYIEYETNANLVGVTPDTAWDEEGATILEDMAKWGTAMLTYGGMIPNFAIMDPAVFTAIRKDSDVQEAMDNRRFDFGSLSVKPLAGYMGVAFSGFMYVDGIGSVALYTYANKYDKDGTQTSYLPSGAFIMGNTMNEGKMMYGALDSFDGAGHPAIVPGTRNIVYETADRIPAVESVVVQMAPLANPFALDSWVYANVL